MDKTECGLLGFTLGLVISLVLHITLGVENSPAYYKKYYEHKEQCDKMLPRTHECYVKGHIWDVKEVLDDSQ